MAIVEDELHNDSEEENEIEVVVEDDDQDSGDESDVSKQNILDQLLMRILRSPSI